MAFNSKKLKRPLSYLLRFAVGGGAVYLAFRGEDPSSVFKAFAGMNLWILALVFVIYFLSQLIFVLRWTVLLRVISIRIPVAAAFKLHLLGLFYNNCLPSFVGGDLLRAWYVTAHTDKKMEAAVSVFIDRVIGLSGMLIMAFSCIWFIPGGTASGIDAAGSVKGFINGAREFLPVLIFFGAALAAAGLLMALFRKSRKMLFEAVLRLRGHLMDIYVKLAEMVKIYYSRKLAVLAALFLTFFCQGLFIIALWLLGLQLGIDAHVRYYFILFPVSWLLGTLPISVGGAGIMELWLKKAFVSISSASGETALALALSQRLVLLLASLPGVLIHLAGAHLPKIGKEFLVDEKG